MFGRFSRQRWKKNGQRNNRGQKSFFGGKVQSMEEIAALTKKIAAHEKKESHAADAMLDVEWGKVEKTPKI